MIYLSLLFLHIFILLLKQFTQNHGGIGLEGGQIWFCDSTTCICNYNGCLFTMEMDSSSALRKAIYELMGKIKNKHKP